VQKKILKSSYLAVVCLISGLSSSLLFANENPSTEKLPLDTVVIMDSSGSMKQTDPKQLRKPAAKLFISLLDKDDRLSVVSFSSQAWPITYLTKLETDKLTKACTPTFIRPLKKASSF